jgi:hypothetical protein
MTTKEWLEIAVALTMPIGFALIILHRIKRDQGLGRRVMQLTGLILIVPTVFILAMEKVLEPQTVGTLLGALAGYLFAGISGEEKAG